MSKLSKFILPVVLYSLVGSWVVVSGGAGVVVKRSQIGEKLMLKEGLSEQQGGTYLKPNGRREVVSCLGLACPPEHWTQGNRLFQKNLGLEMLLHKFSVCDV